MRKFIKDMLINGSGVSSKRVNGTLGWLLCSFVFVYSSISKGLGEYHLLYMGFCTALLGLDSVLNVFKNRKK